MSKGSFVSVLVSSLVGLSCVQNIHSAEAITDANPMAIPHVGDYQLRILTPNLLELTLINSAAEGSTAVTNWNFVNNNSFNAPSSLAVTVNGLPDVISSVGFRRRPIYAPLNEYDLRVGNYLYISLAAPIPVSASVAVSNPDGTLWTSPVQYQATSDPARFSPAIHVNQEGYMPGYIKTAEIGYYAGSLGEVQLAATLGFNLINATNNQVVYSGALTVRPDVGFETSKFSPLPYQDVLEANFTAFNTPGEYRLQVPGLGASYSFTISDGLAALFARTYELGLYHQRCGYSNELPYTRFVKDACHTAPASIPTPAFLATNAVTANVLSTLSDGALTFANMNFPYVNTGTVDTHGGHHDAGDYSKYTDDVAQLCHNLLFAVDALPGVAQLDNLGIPESGDGIPDVLQEAMWEIDYLSRLQDADGGFYSVVYPRDRQYENTDSLVSGNDGDPQVVYPKTTIATGAAVGALAEAGSSPWVKKYYPAQAAKYLAEAELGWQFLQNAFNTYGRGNGAQYVNQYGAQYSDIDETAWAAAALYAATGNTAYQSDLTNHFDPSDPNTIYWSWWRMYDAYGCAIRDYAFAARTGRLQPSQLDPAYLAKCEQQIVLCGDDNVNWASQSAYRDSYSPAYKGPDNPGWIFAVNQNFDLAVANVVSNKQAYVDTMIGNMNYEAGCNPVNMGFVTGVAWRRQHQIVSQYADNQARQLPPTGIPLGSQQQGFDGAIAPYLSQPGSLTFPSDGGTSANGPHYAPYDRWADAFNTETELISPQQGRCVAATAYLMAQTAVSNQSWTYAVGSIQGLPTQVPAGTTINATLSASGIDLAQASYVWEATGQDPTPGAVFTFAPNTVGANWIEVEATLPDGRRVFATNQFRASAPTNVPPNAVESTDVSTSASGLVALYQFDGNWTDSTGREGAMAPSGGAVLDPSNVSWMANPSGDSLAAVVPGDQAVVAINSSDLYNPGTTQITVQAMIYVNSFLGDNDDVIALGTQGDNWQSTLELWDNPYGGVTFRGAGTSVAAGSTVTQALTPGVWHQLTMSISQTAYTLLVDGKTIATAPSSDLPNWASNGGVHKLVLGNFNGWIDEVAIYNNAVGAVTNPTNPTNPTQPETTVATPTISPAGGNYTSAVSVSVSCATANAAIHYTLDGSAPTASSPVVSGPITVSANAIVQAMAVANSMSNSAVASAQFTVTSIGNWYDANIGSVGYQGSATQSGSSFTVSGGGADIWGSADAFNYVYQTLTGDGQIVAQVDSVQLTDPWAKAGVMFRQSLAPGSPQIIALVSADSGTALQYRASPDDGAVNLGGSAALAPCWLKLVRAGNLFTAYSSADGVNWSGMGSVSINMTDPIYVGLAVCAHNNAELCAAAFSSVQVSGASTGTNYSNPATNTSTSSKPLPTPWKHEDLGSVGSAGSASYSAGAFTVTGSGADIWGTADAFHFVQQPWTGNGSIIVKVASISDTDPWAKAGVMIRAGLTPNAAQAMAVLTPGNGATFQYRATTGASAIEATDFPADAAPGWLKISRSSNTFTSYYSADGKTWFQIGSAKISMPRTVYIGLAVCAHNNSLVNTSTFSNVTVSAKL